MNKLVDLTYPLDDNCPSWDNKTGFTLTNVLNYADCATEIKFCVQKIFLQAGIGTHMDAPAHCFANGLTIDKIPLESLIVPGIVIDVSHKADANYIITVQDLYDFENIYGHIAPNSLVIMKTGWGCYWANRMQYHNNWQFPSMSPELAKALLERQIVGIGIDTLGPDLPISGFPVHRILLGAGKYIVENVANVENLPFVGFQVMVMPLCIKNATEAPVRMTAFVKNYT